MNLDKPKMIQISAIQRAQSKRSDGIGIFKIIPEQHPEIMKKLNINAKDLETPQVNVYAAMAILEAKGYEGFDSYNDGSYQTYLDAADAAMGGFNDKPWRQFSNMNPRLLQLVRPEDQVGPEDIQGLPVTPYN